MLATGWRRTAVDLTRFRSVRFRITLVAVIVLAVVLSATGALLLAVQRNQQLANLDTSLSRRADDVAGLIDDPGDSPRVLASQAGDDAVVQVVDGGRIVAGTPNAVSLAPIATPPVGRESIATVSTLPVEDDRYRLLSRRISSAEGEVVVHVAENLDDADDVNRALLVALLFAVPMSVAVLSALVWILVGRALRPVEALRSEVADIRGTDLARRVTKPASGDEIERLAGTMNSMLDRVQDATDRQQRFVGDASHELRSPLTRMRAELEVDLADADTSDLVATHESVLAEATELSALLDDLLLLARLGPDAPNRRTEVDLDDLVLAESRQRREEGSVVDVTAVTPVSVLGDQAQLMRVVRNLLDNAVRHADSRVSVTLSEADGRAILEVTDDGPGVPTEHADHIFQRFTRLDQARARQDGGTGLGLAIVREIVERHDGVVNLDRNHRPGARFVVDLPVDGGL